MDMANVFSIVLLMGCIIMIGAFLVKVAPLTEESRNLMIGIVVNIGMPCIILTSMFHFPIDSDMFDQILLVFLFSVFINVLGMGLGLLWSCINRDGQKAREIAVISGLGTTGYIGIPLCAALFGPKGALFAAIFDAGVDVTIWTVAAFILQRKMTISFRLCKDMINVPMLAIGAGLTLAYFHWHPPQFIGKLIDSLAGLAAPLAMLYVGMIIPALWKKRSQVSLTNISIPILVKLLILPVLAACLVKLIPVEADTAKVIILQAAMPTMAMASIIFAKYSADEEMGATATVFSTVLSLSTIPIMVYLIDIFMY